MGRKIVFVCDQCGNVIQDGYYRAVVSGYKPKSKVTNRTFYFCNECGSKIFKISESTEEHKEGEEE